MKIHIVLSIITFLIILAAYRTYQSNSLEGFQGAPGSSEIAITMCPKNTNSINTAKGNTDCCSGDLIDGKCNGSTVCTISPAHDDVPTCLGYWKNYYESKGKALCPSSLPNYFEDIEDPSKVKGCSASLTSTNGKEPRDAQAKKCILYTNERDNLTKEDSCFLEKEKMEKTCPIVDNQRVSPQFYIQNNEVKSYKCTYGVEPDNLPYECFDDSSYTRYVNMFNPSEKPTLEGMRLNRFCSTINERRAQIREEKRRREEEDRKRRQLEEELKKVKSFFSGIFGKLGIRF